MERCYTYVCCLILLLGSSLSTFAFSVEDQDQQPAPASPTVTPQKLHVKKDSKDDIEAIGKRKIVDQDWYSLNREIRLGQLEAEQVDAQIKLLDDLSVAGYISSIGQKLLRNSDVQLPVTIKVVDSNEASVFSLLGGYLYINSGLVLDCANEAELAGVVSHTIAHIAARHVTRIATREELLNITSMPLIFVGDGIGYGSKNPPRPQKTVLIPQADWLGREIPLGLVKFYRTFEVEADYFGIQYLYKTGYDPMAFVARLRREDNRHHVEPGSSEAKSAAQPVPAERIAAAEKEIARILPPNDHLVVNTPEFDSIKAKLAARKNQSQEEKQAPK
jgi:beta-barrel assembly-enhancing protease